MRIVQKEENRLAWAGLHYSEPNEKSDSWVVLQCDPEHMCIHTAERMWATSNCGLSDLISNACSHLYLELSTCDKITQDTCWYQSVNKKSPSITGLRVKRWSELSLSHIKDVLTRPTGQTDRTVWHILYDMQGPSHRSRSWSVQSAAALTEFPAFNRNWFL